MPWFWTDDIAHLLIERGVVSRDQVTGWMERPVAIPGAENTDPIELGLGLLGLAGDVGDSEVGAA